ncbi:MAG: flippase-like domain-containing protein [Chitinispirillales bacterium]|nr:flippase-like domain-containing protein [Chitinispirillales bacterium]
MASKNHTRKIISSSAKLLATVLIIAFLIRRLGWGTIATTIAGANPLWLAAGSVVFFVSIWLGSVQWYWLLRNRGLSLPFSRTFKLYFVGMFFNNFIMGGIVGDAVKVASIRARDGKGKVGFAATFLDRFAGLWALCGFAVVGSIILLSRGMLTHGRIETAVIALFAAFALFAGIMLFLIFKPIQIFFFSITDRFAFFRKLKIKEIISEMLFEAQDYKLLASVAMLAFLTQFLRIGSNILIAASLNLVTAENFQYFFIFIPIVSMLMTVPLPFGVRETFGGVLFALAGFQPDAAFIMGFLASLIAIAISSLGGFFFVTEKMYKSSSKKNGA